MRVRAVCVGVLVGLAMMVMPSSASAVTYLSGGLYPGGGTEHSLAYWYQNQMGNSNVPYAGHRVHLRFRWYNGMASQHMYSYTVTASMTRDYSVWSWPGCWRVSEAGGGGSGYYTNYWCAALT
jgi:hypothetical protein